MHRVRRWLISLLQDTEDEIPNDLIPEYVPEIPLPSEQAHASLDTIQNNHIYHLTVGHNHIARAINGIQVRVGRVEAKTGIALYILMSLLLFAVEPYIKDAIITLVHGF